LNSLLANHRPRLAAVFLAALSSVPAFSTRAAAPGDVFYSVRVIHTFKHYVFPGDFVVWTDSTYEGTSLLKTAGHDSATATTYVNMATALEAGDGAFTADLTSETTAEVSRGLYYQTFNDLDVTIYIRGPSGTPFDITLDIAATLDASREGGLPGTLQDVNGISTAALEESTLTVADGGTESLSFDRFELFSDTTTTEILVNNETYSLARTINLNAFTSVTQILCILGCMTEPAQFLARVSSHVRINAYPNGAPSGARAAPRPPIALTASPNPWSGSTLVSFRAPQGTPTTIDVFDVRGRRVARLFDAPATGDVQSLPWNATNLASGVYFLRAESGRLSSTKKLMLLK
jgi:hypothetical protein